jgi:hypothetical protein
MYAVVRDNQFDPQRWADGQDQVRAFQAEHARQPGYCGTVVVDVGDGRQLSFTLWRSRAEAEAARGSLGPTIGRTLEPLMARPSVLLGVGEVVYEDLAAGRTSGSPDARA